MNYISAFRTTFSKIIFFGLVLASVVGLTGFKISKHICGGETVAVSVNVEKESCCESSELGSSCCTNEVEVFKISDKFLSYSNLFDSSLDNSFVVVQPFDYSKFFRFFSCNSKKANVGYDPPILPRANILALLCTFLN